MGAVDVRPCSNRRVGFLIGVRPRPGGEPPLQKVRPMKSTISDWSRKAGGCLDERQRLWLAVLEAIDALNEAIDEAKAAGVKLEYPAVSWGALGDIESAVLRARPRGR